MPKSPALNQSRPGRITAAEDMRRQLDEADGYAYNASRMFRAVGSPEGHDPESWLEKADPLVFGMKSYFASLGDCFGEEHGQDDELVDYLDEMDEEDDSRVGDTTMTYLLALTYAMYLDFAVHELAKAD